jgi:hypothetical protein
VESVVVLLGEASSVAGAFVGGAARELAKVAAANELTISESVPREVLMGINAALLALAAAAATFPLEFFASSAAATHALNARDLFRMRRAQYIRESFLRAAWVTGSFCGASVFLQLLDRVSPEHWENSNSVMLLAATNVTTLGVLFGGLVLLFRAALFPRTPRHLKIG